ncbi:MAG: hypothetical protein HQL12_08255 [Candidatus Omnitrophica bacterium]|nr:hypothetical protein [Candidatus Omnitrophota bacterium]
MLKGFLYVRQGVASLRITAFSWAVAARYWEYSKFISYFTVHPVIKQFIDPVG